MLASKTSLNFELLADLIKWNSELLVEKHYRIGELEACNIPKVLTNNLELFSDVFTIIDYNLVEVSKSNPEAKYILYYY